MRDYEGIIRAIVLGGNEGPKVDFKQRIDFTSRFEVARLARLILAIANTDSDDLDDIGY